MNTEPGTRNAPSFRRLLFCLLPIAFGISVAAQPFTIDWHTIDGGGGTSTFGQYTLSGTIGQPDAGPMTGGNYTLQGGFWSAYVAVQTPGAPTLAIRRVGNNVEISWPVNGFVGFGLEAATNLASPVSWLSAGGSQAVVNGSYVVALPIQAGHHFFRLFKPPE